MAAAFIFDCSQTMNDPQPMLVGSSGPGGAQPATKETRPIDAMKTFAKAKIAQRVSHNITVSP